MNGGERLPKKTPGLWDYQGVSWQGHDKGLQLPLLMGWDAKVNQLSKDYCGGF